MVTARRSIPGVWFRFRDLSELDDDRASALLPEAARLYPAEALEALGRVLDPVGVERLAEFVRGRKNVVTALERLTWRRETFFDAARLLLRLAEAENEPWANNATGVWGSLFLTHRSRTAVPAAERFSLLEEALLADSAKIRQLAVAALKTALSTRETSIEDAERDDFRLPRPWRPRGLEEDQACRRAALAVLDAALHDRDEGVREQARQVLFDSSRGLVRLGLTEEILARFEVLDAQSDNERKNAWEAVGSILRFEDSHLSDEQRRQLSARADQLLGNSLHDRLRRYVGHVSHLDWSRWDAPLEQRPEFSAARLADDAIRDPETLRAELPWLTSGEADNVGYFGRRLGELDVAHVWLDELVASALTGNDVRLVSLYLDGRAAAGEHEWREHLLDHWAENPARAQLVVDATLRGEPSRRGVNRLVWLVDVGWLAPRHLIGLGQARWAQRISAVALRELLRRMARDDSAPTSEAGLALIADWVQGHAKGLPSTLEPLAWAFLERPSSASGGPGLAYYWVEVGRLLVPRNPVRVAKAVLRALDSELLGSADERLLLLSEALSRDPQGVWKAIGHQLIRSEEAAFRLHLWAGEAGLLDQLDSEDLLRWARKQPRKRPRLLAKLAKPTRPLSSIVRGLLEEYGADSAPARALRSNFESGDWDGPMVAHQERQIEIAREWLHDSQPTVREWAQHIVEALEEEIQGLRASGLEWF